MEVCKRAEVVEASSECLKEMFAKVGFGEGEERGRGGEGQGGVAEVYKKAGEKAMEAYRASMDFVVESPG